MPSPLTPELDAILRKTASSLFGYAKSQAPNFDYAKILALFSPGAVSSVFVLKKADGGVIKSDGGPDVDSELLELLELRKASNFSWKAFKLLVDHNGECTTDFYHEDDGSLDEFIKEMAG